MYKNIDNIYFLILNSKDHEYQDKGKIDLSNDNQFSFKNNIMNFNKLILEIENKCKENDKFIIETYECISMLYDSGRLKYTNIIDETNILMAKSEQNSDNTIFWQNGYGDIHLSAFIPTSYFNERGLSCLIQIRQSNLSGCLITLEREDLLKDFFVSEEEFEQRHLLGRCDDEEEMFVNIKNNRIKINAYTAHHLYELFREFN